MLSECCSSPPMTDVHDGIGICDVCREWCGFYDEEEDEPEDVYRTGWTSDNNNLIQQRVDRDDYRIGRDKDNRESGEWREPINFKKEDSDAGN